MVLRSFVNEEQNICVLKWNILEDTENDGWMGWFFISAVIQGFSLFLVFAYLMG